MTQYDTFDVGCLSTQHRIHRPLLYTSLDTVGACVARLAISCDACARTTDSGLYYSSVCIQSTPRCILLTTVVLQVCFPVLRFVAHSCSKAFL